MLEYDKGKPSALVEYKNEHAAPQHRTHPSYQALINMGNIASLPVFAVRYADDFSWWRVTPLNGFAKRWVTIQQEMDEREYVTLLYRIRGREVPLSFFDGWEETL